MRSLLILSALPLLASTLSAQCLNTTGGVNAGLLTTTAFYPANDEGRSAPIDMLFGPAGFPMAGATGPLTHVVVGSNGELYLTNGGAPVGAIDYGGYDSFNLRGNLGDSPRVWPCSTDLEGIAAGYGVTVDTSVPGRCKVNWIDVEQFFSGGPQFSFSAALYNTGVIELSYSNLASDIYGIAGVSIGNGVGTGLETSVDLTTGPDSGTLGLIFQEMDGLNLASFSGRTLTVIPNGTGGYLSIKTCEPASNTEYGFGCHTFVNPIDGSNFVEEFIGTPAAKVALDGNALLFQKTAGGFVANWLPGTAGALYVPPTGSATALSLFDDDVANITPSVAPPVPGGTAPVWTISSNGILTAAAAGNSDTNYFADLTEVGSETGLAFYNWRDYNPSLSGSGAVKYEEAGGKLLVTFDGVYEYGTSNPATFQWQVDLATGDVMMVWVSMATSTNTTSMIVGCTLVGSSSSAPTSASLSATPVTLTPLLALTPMTLAAAPAPAINPSTVVTYTANNLPEFAPSSGIYLSTCFLSVNPNPGGFDLAGILTTVPGCNAWILTLDLDLGAQLTFAPTASWNVTYSNAFFTPGNVIAAQAVALFDGSFPLANGESGGFLLSNGVSSNVQAQ